MAKPLVIVESPAKAKTISKFLGNAFDVRASVGHVADLPSKGLAVDVDNGFKPTYELTERGKQVVKDLQAGAEGRQRAVPRDRRGPRGRGHQLAPARVPQAEGPVKRMVFHEITKAAIDHAVNNPRGIDYGLVDAAETRRILDRLYGYEVSPVLWRRVNRGLSAGRVQSPSIRLIVERERERIAFVAAGYWDIELLTATSPAFTATSSPSTAPRSPPARTSTATARPRPSVVVLDEARARALADGLAGADVHASARSRRSRTAASPKAPFMTSTLQQEGGRKLRLSASQVMRVAQGLYERGYITYMRTDNVDAVDEALAGGARRGRQRRTAQQFLSPHAEAVHVEDQERPGGPRGDPPDDAAAHAPTQVAGRAERPGAGAVPPDLAAHAGLADGRRHRHHRHRPPRRACRRPTATDCEFAASRHDDHVPRLPRRSTSSRSTTTTADDDEREALLPPLAVGDVVPVDSLDAATATPPRRRPATPRRRS